MKIKIFTILFLVIILTLITLMYTQNTQTSKQEIITTDAKSVTEPECENFQDIQTFSTPVPVTWDAVLDGCVVSCEGGIFTRINIDENENYPRFVGYMKEGQTIDVKYLDKKVRIKGNWTSIEEDYAKTVFNNKCVPIVEIENIN